MQYDLEAAYQQSLPDFIQVLSGGFSVAGKVQPSLEVSIQDEQLVRTLWDHGRPLCRSIGGYSSITNGKVCRVCRDLRRCTAQIILFVLLDSDPFRIALNHTSGQNYLAYRRNSCNTNRDLCHVLTQISIISHDSWGEVHFQELP
jgi:hypothetical protein